LSIIEAFGKVIKLTPEYLRLSLSEATIQELRSLVSKDPLSKEAVESIQMFLSAMRSSGIQAPSVRP
jgi:hypothetical protein